MICLVSPSKKKYYKCIHINILGLNPTNEDKPPIRSKWAAEFGQHASLAIVPAAQAAIDACKNNNSNLVDSPIIPSEIIKCFI